MNHTHQRTTLAILLSLCIFSCSEPVEPEEEVIILTPTADMGAPPKDMQPEPERDLGAPDDMARVDMSAEPDMATPAEDMDTPPRRTLWRYDVWGAAELENHAPDPRMTHTFNRHNSDLPAWNMMKLRPNSESIWRVVRVVSHNEPQGGRTAYAVSEIESGWDEKILGSFISIDDPTMTVGIWIGVSSPEVSTFNFKWPTAYITFPVAELGGIFRANIPLTAGLRHSHDGITWQLFSGALPGTFAGRAFLYAQGSSYKKFYVKRPVALSEPPMPEALRAPRFIEPVLLPSNQDNLSSLFDRQSSPTNTRQVHPHRL